MHVTERDAMAATRRALIAELRQRVAEGRLPDLSDAGNAGVPDDEFVAGWDGVRLQPPNLVLGRGGANG